MTTIRCMRFGDLRAGLRLSAQAGWNQTANDWQRFVDLQPEGCFVAVYEDQVVGTVTTCEFGDVAWIGMMLVQQRHRGRGIGTALMQRAMDHLSDRQVRSIRLDATPLGEPLYRKLGFVSQYGLTRFAGTLTAVARPTWPRPLEPDDTASLLALDEEVMGYDRSRLITRFMENAEQSACFRNEAGEVQGYVLTRPGRLARFIGPCIATPQCGTSLLSAAFAGLEDRCVMLDIPQLNDAAIATAEAAGLVPQRKLLRMCRGDIVTERVDCLWAGSGPETG